MFGPHLKGNKKSEMREISVDIEKYKTLERMKYVWSPVGGT